MAPAKQQQKGLLGKLLGKAFEDYKNNFAANVPFILLYYALPLLLILVATNYMLPADFYSVEEPTFGVREILALGLQGILLSLLGIYVQGSIVATSVGKKYTASALRENGPRYFGRFLVFSIILGLFMLVLSLPLFIPALIFGVYWMLSPFVYFAEKTSVVESFRRSFRLLKGRWWVTLGYLIVVMLISIVIQIPITLITVASSLLTLVTDLISPYLTTLVISVVTALEQTLAFIFIMPLFVYFYKHYYLALKGKKK